MPLPRLQPLQIAQPQPGTMQLQGMKMKNELARTGTYQKSVGIQEQRLAFDKMKNQISLAKDFIPQITQSNYGDFVAWNVENGIPEEIFKSVDEVNDMTSEQFNAYQTEMSQGADDLAGMTLEEAQQANKEEIQRQKAADAKKLQEQKTEATRELQEQKDKAAMERTKITAGKSTEDTKKTIASHIARISRLSATKGFTELDIAMGGEGIIEQMKEGLTDEAKKEIDWRAKEIQRLQGQTGEETTPYGTEEDPKRGEAEAFLKEKGMPVTDANIDYYMENY